MLTQHESCLVEMSMEAHQNHNINQAELTVFPRLPPRNFVELHPTSEVCAVGFTLKMTWFFGDEPPLTGYGKVLLSSV